MDVYFERIAGVAEAKATRRMPRVEGGEPTEAMVPDAEEVELDDDGFPVSPLKDQDHLWFVQAAQLYRPLQRCARTARGNGALMIAGGLLTGLAGLVVFHVVTMVVGLILITLGSMERSTARDVAAARPGSTGRLAFNQLVLFALVALYCGAQMKSFHTAYAKTGFRTDELVERIERLPGELGQVGAQLEALGPSLQATVPNLVYAFWALVAVSSLFFQGTLALYYLTRKRRIRLFYQELPPWVVDIVKTITVR